MIRRRLALTPAMEGERLSAAFGGPGLLFLSSGPDGLSLSDAPRAGELLHAIFLSRRLAVFGVAVSSSTLLLLEGGDGLRRVRDGARVNVGNRRLVVRLGRHASSRRERTGRILTAAAVAGALAMALAFLLRGPGPRATAASEQASAAVPSAGRDAALPPLGARAAALVEEARAHAMEGRRQQARLALVEAMELQPDDPRIAALLEEVGREPEGAAPDGANAIEGLMEPAVEEARRKAMEELKARSSDRILALRRLIEEAPGMEAPRAVRELASARRGVEEMARAMPQEAEVIRLRERIDAALAAAAARGIAAAAAAERYAGCGEALPLYRAIAASLEGVDPMRGREASEGIKRCQIGAEARGR